MKLDLTAFGTWALARVREPSTWAGLAMFGGLVLAREAPWAPWLEPAIAVCSAAAVALKEKAQ